MQTQPIAEVGIDDEQRVFVRPVSGDFEHIYRAAMEVYWECATGRLSYPAPRNWTAPQWYQQIIAATADEYGIELQLTDETIWSNVPSNVRIQIETDSRVNDS